MNFHKLSLRFKMPLILLIFLICLIVLINIFVYNFFRNNVEETYCDVLNRHGYTVFTTFFRLPDDVSAINSYAADTGLSANNVPTESLDRIKEVFTRLLSTDDIVEITLYYNDLDPEIPTGTCLLDCVADGLDLVPMANPGDVIDLYDYKASTFLSFETSYGSMRTQRINSKWYCTGRFMYFDTNSDLSAFTIDIRMDITDGIDQNETNFKNLFFYILFLGITLIATIMRLIKRNLISPINLLTKAVTEFGEKQKEGKYAESDRLLKEQILKTGDEIEDLTNAFSRMEKDINGYIDDITRISEEKARFQTELNLAAEIQLGILPHTFPSDDHFSIYASTKPARTVGGDFYDCLRTDNDHLSFLMADVSGKGMPAALFMMIGKLLSSVQMRNLQDPGMVLTEMNRILCQNNPNDLFITAFQGTLDLRTGQMTFANAGHEHPLIYRAESGTVEELEVNPGFVLAAFDTMKYRSFSTVLHPGDKVLLYTDGVTEANNSQGIMYGIQNLKANFIQHHDLSSEKLTDEIHKCLNDYAENAEQFDDITILCLEYK